ncbi:cyclic-di-AMP-binding protein CbpB [Vagococcus sp.]|uniref:cyclic-di-AMP-binding protein CbpB n=1 Tax=Vagococcus sp. TaxID=1933889 RepID=UPI003F9D7C7A
MIGQTVKEILLENEDHFLVDSENVATLQDTNTLEHAFLVLTNIGYSRIPVVDRDEKLVGSISLSMVVSEMITTKEIDPDLLAIKKVSEVMDQKVKCLQQPFDIEKTLNLLVDANFAHVVDSEGVFKGIVTRKEILKAVNHLVHELETRYHLENK